MTPSEAAVVHAARRLRAVVPADWRGTLRPEFAALCAAVEALDRVEARRPKAVVT